MKPRYRIKRIGDLSSVSDVYKSVYKMFYQAELIANAQGLFICKQV